MAAKPKPKKKKDEIPEYTPDPNTPTADIRPSLGDPPDDSTMVNVGRMGTININDLSPDQRSMAYTAGAKQGLSPEYFQKAYGTPTGADGQPLEEKDLYLPVTSFGSAMVDPRTGDYFTGNNQWIAQQSAKLKAQGLPSLIPQAQYERDKKFYEDKYVDAQFDEQGMLDPERAKTFADFRGRMLRKMALDKQAAEGAEPEPAAPAPLSPDVVEDPETGSLSTDVGGPEGMELDPDLEAALARDIARGKARGKAPAPAPAEELYPAPPSEFEGGYAEDEGVDTSKITGADLLPYAGFGEELAPEPDDEDFGDDDDDKPEPVPFFGPDRRDESAKTVFGFLYNKGLDPYGNDDANLARLVDYLSDERFANMTPSEAVEAMRDAIEAGEYTL
jgi:hypothetical protein